MTVTRPRCLYGHTSPFGGCEECPYVEWPQEPSTSMPDKLPADVERGLDLCAWLVSTLQLEGETPPEFRDFIIQAFADHRVDAIAKAVQS